MGKRKEGEGRQPDAGALSRLNTNDKLRAIEAIISLARMRIGNPSTIAPLDRALDDEERQVRGTAAKAMGLLAKIGIGATSSIKGLNAILADASPDVRASAAEALFRLANIDLVSTTSVGPLLKLISDKDANVRKAATRSLVRICERFEEGPSTRKGANTIRGSMAACLSGAMDGITMSPEETKVETTGPPPEYEFEARLSDENRRAFRSGKEAFYRDLPDLLLQGRLGQYAAYIEGKLVGIGDDEESLLEKLDCELGRAPDYVGYIGNDGIEEEKV